MPASDLRRALDDAKKLILTDPNNIQENIEADEACHRALPNLLVVLREVARLHQQWWWADFLERENATLLKHETIWRAWNDGGEDAKNAAIAASPEWRDAFRKQYDIDPKEIDL